MTAGTLWTMPGGHKAIEVEGSTRTTLRLSVIAPGWPFPKPPVEVARCLCERAPMRYHGGAPTVDRDGEALL